MKADREDELALRTAIVAAKRAWERIAPLYGGSFTIHEKEDGPATTADRLADRVIQEELCAVFPASEYGYLTEESQDSDERLARERVWIIDPIDGTNDFIDQTGQFCIQIGLVRQCCGLWRLAAGVVYPPAEGRIYWALAGKGAWVQDAGGSAPPQRLAVSSDPGPAGLRAVISRSHVSKTVTRLVDSLGAAERLQVGSVGVKITRLCSGQADFYVNTAIDKTCEWDACAPHIILAEAGGRMTDMAGGELAYNGRNVRHPCGFLASNGVCHDAIVAGIRAHFANPATEAPGELRARLGIQPANAPSSPGL